ncbi:NAD(P)-binding protein [Backusella circina FSU 941]|nr:NAD(P)-binding protein [Backusella circina FSU 941]
MTERIFVTGATGNIGIKLVQFLLKKDAQITVYVRNMEKAKKVLPQTNNIKFVEGDYSTMDVFEREIKGHSRLFILVSVAPDVVNIKSTLSRIAYAAGVRQIVDISSIAINFGHRSSTFASLDCQCEDLSLAAAGKGQYFVALRPFHFFSNHIMLDIRSIKENQTLNSIQDLDLEEDFISPTDIAELASVVLTESVEKHENCVYNMIGETLSAKERAAIFSELLGKTVKASNIPIQALYDTFTSFGMKHSIVIDLIQTRKPLGPTPYFGVMIGRPPQTLREWLLEDNNLAHFQ